MVGDIFECNNDNINNYYSIANVCNFCVICKNI